MPKRIQDRLFYLGADEGWIDDDLGLVPGSSGKVLAKTHGALLINWGSGNIQWIPSRHMGDYKETRARSLI